ncbi:regulatory protein RecX [Effusibacillus lacus]|uniref:Regulatory protein RecX n=1 Tax=Effusibacillus lacus TaxID=1348429 RepID=A0A292YSB0_9BACL|nr:RecX family transcriptional regulator [Effusibacillus lacus]TCS76252.1 regulatory protein [Effusibacillus lacus]GAX91801.1 hypothetical protein EFBL_3492 [Effusibacillus lacus]
MSSLGKISAIQTQKAHPDRVSLFVDGEFVLGIRRELAYHLKLRIGQEVTAEDVSRWKQEEECLQAKELAIRYISARSRSRQQVLSYLIRKEIPQEVAEVAVKFLESQGYLNDDEFASEFVRQRLEAKPRGRRMIRWELQQKGIHNDTIERAMAVYGDEVEAAKRLLSRMSLQKGKDREQNRKTEQRIARFLASKGFSAETIQSILKNIRKV